MDMYIDTTLGFVRMCGLVYLVFIVQPLVENEYDCDYANQDLPIIYQYCGLTFLPNDDQMGLSIYTYWRTSSMNNVSVSSCLDGAPDAYHFHHRT